jgi:hypothetical protein
LSGTYDDLVAVERDRGYHRNDEFITRDSTGKEVFDKQRFAQVFETSNTTLAQTFQDKARVTQKVDDNALERMMADRDRLLVDFQQQVPREDLLGDNKRFNRVFEDLRRQRQELVEVGDGLGAFGDNLSWGQYETVHSGLANAGWQPEASGLLNAHGGLNLASPGFHHGVVRDILQAPIATSASDDDWKARQSTRDNEALVARYLEESQRLREFRREQVVRVGDEKAAEEALAGGHVGFIETVDKQRLDYNDVANPEEDDEAYFANQATRGKK